MTSAIRIALVAILLQLVARAEPRTFTNTEGKTVKAELIALEAANAVLKLANGHVTNVPLATLSEKDQAFIKAWWEENKNKVADGDVRLNIKKNTNRIDRQASRPGNAPANSRTAPVSKKMTLDEISFACELENFSRKDIEDIEVNYTIYKRISERNKEGSSTEDEEIADSDSIRLLKAHGKASFETLPVRCEDSYEKVGNSPAMTKRETILGFVVTLSAGGKEFLKQSHPENFIDRLEEEEKREEDRDD